MLRTTMGQLMINESLPEELRDYERILDKKGIRDLLETVARDHPDRYRQVAKRLSDVGRHSSFSSGSYSFGLKSMRQPLAARQMRLDLARDLREVYTSDMSDQEKEQAILSTVGKYQATLADSVMKEATEQQNPLAMQAISGARGNKTNLNSLIGADLLYTDHRGKALPIPVMRSYSMGLRPYEYFAGAFGARKGVIDLKAATQDAGFFGKQLVQAAHRLLVSKMDDENPYDETNPRGFPADTTDPDNAGGFLAHPVGGYPRNTQLTPKILKELSANGVNQILVRSPTVGGPDDGGVYARDVGIRERSTGLAPVGDFVGTTAGQSLAEPVTQAQISSKHSGGVAGAGAGAISGFKYINALVQVPKKYPGGAAHSQVDGRVGDIREAPQGGHFVTVGGKEHYVGQGFELRVKPGDEVEAGDVLSDGVPNPGEIVQHKGIGEGRRYFVQAFRDALTGSGVSGDRRNIELLSRGLINHVRLTDEIGDYVPDDVVPYQLIESRWKPRTGHVVVPPAQAKGYYLERPTLHYSVGTRVQPSMLKMMEQHGVKNVYVHKEPPPFEPEMIRGMANASHDPDWFTRMLGSYQQSSVLDAAHRGAVSDEDGSSYVPSLARGENFGRTGLTKGWKPSETMHQMSTPVTSGPIPKR
jgi:hypothetical protein